MTERSRLNAGETCLHTPHPPNATSRCGRPSCCGHRCDKRQAGRGSVINGGQGRPAHHQVPGHSVRTKEPRGVTQRARKPSGTDQRGEKAASEATRTDRIRLQEAPSCPAGVAPPAVSVAHAPEATLGPGQGRARGEGSVLRRGHAGASEPWLSHPCSSLSPSSLPL